jgi:hypothetical protein
MSSAVEVKECTKCHHVFPLAVFKGFNGRDCKWCEKCRESQGRTNAKRRAPGGKGRCEHGLLSGECRECSPENFCGHGRRRALCRRCAPDPPRLIITQWMTHSKHEDKKRNHYDPENFIDRPFLEQLIRDHSGRCIYCEIELDYRVDIGEPGLPTIERISNDVGHIKTNVTVCCYFCNVGRVGQR